MKVIDPAINPREYVRVKAKEQGICEKAAKLWGQAVEEGFEETEDKSGLTIEMFQGSHYAIGALKGFWTPTKDGFRLINQAVSDLEKLLLGEEQEAVAEKKLKGRKAKPEKSDALRTPSSKKPDPRAMWRITRYSDGSDGFIYTTLGVNGYSVGRYLGETQPGERINVDGVDLLPEEIPSDFTFEDDNISDAIVIWLKSCYNIEVIREPSKEFEANIEVDEEEGLITVWELDDAGATLWSYFSLANYKVIDCANEVIQSFDNFRVIFVGSES